MLTPTIYVFGDLPTFTQALTALQMIFNPANNTDWAVGGASFGTGPVVVLGMLVSLLMITTKGVFMQKIELHHVGMLLGLYAAMFIPTTTVDLHDMYSGQDQIVDGIPIGVAYPAAAVSNLAYDAATQIGQAFQAVTANAPPTSITSGFASPLMQMLAVKKMYGNFVMQDPLLANDIGHFVQQCVYPQTAANVAGWDIKSLLSAPNLAGQILNSNTATLQGNAVLQGPIPGSATCATATCAETCQTAQSDLYSAFNAWVNSTAAGGCGSVAQLSSTGKDSAPMTDCTGTALNSTLVAASSGAGGIVTSAANQGADFMKNAMMSCLATVGLSYGRDVNAPVDLPSYCEIDATALQAQQIGNAGTASVFLQNMIPMMSVLQFLFFALAPLAAATMVFAGAQGIGMFMKYITFGLWTQSWLPVAAVLNSYAQISAQTQLAKIGLALTGGGATTASATTLVQWSSLQPVFDHVQMILSNADMMLALTPVITMIVFTGSYMGMSQLAQDIAGSDKVDKSTGLAAPGISSQEAIVGTQAVAGASTPFHNIGAIAEASTLQLGASSSLAAAQATTNATKLSQSAAQTFGTTASRAATVLMNDQHQVTQDAAAGVSGAHELSTALSTAQSNSHDTSVGTEANLIFGLAYAAGLKGLQGAPLSAAQKDQKARAYAMSAVGSAIGGASGDEMAKQADKMSSADALHIGSTLTHGNSAKYLEKADDTYRKTHGHGTTDSLGTSLQHAETQTKTAMAAVEQAESATETAARIRTSGGKTELGASQLIALGSNLPDSHGDAATGLRNLVARHGGEGALTAFDAADARNQTLFHMSPDTAAAHALAEIAPQFSGVDEATFNAINPGMAGNQQARMAALAANVNKAIGKAAGPNQTNPDGTLNLHNPPSAVSPGWTPADTAGVGALASRGQAAEAQAIVATSAAGAPAPTAAQQRLLDQGPGGTYTGAAGGIEAAGQAATGHYLSADANKTMADIKGSLLSRGAAEMSKHPGIALAALGATNALGGLLSQFSGNMRKDAEAGSAALVAKKALAGGATPPEDGGPPSEPGGGGATAGGATPPEDGGPPSEPGGGGATVGEPPLEPVNPATADIGAHLAQGPVMAAEGAVAGTAETAADRAAVDDVGAILGQFAAKTAARSSGLAANVVPVVGEAVDLGLAVMTVNDAVTAGGQIIELARDNPGLTKALADKLYASGEAMIERAGAAQAAGQTEVPMVGL
jgi:conjugal transfer mating pair stabilization protein TraG